jgi:diguanylate cyclase (GGDEF)-like protein
MSRDSPIILIVDDNPNNLKVLEGILTMGGYQVRPALGGETALRAAGTVEPDLILLDIRMPGMDGYEVCRRLKELNATRDVPVVFISALQDLEDKVEAFRAGGQDYIVKPFQSDEVLARVRTHVELSRSRRLLTRAKEHLEEVVTARTQALTESNARLEQSMRQEQALRHLLALSHSQLQTGDFLNQSLQWLSDVFHWQAPRRKTAVLLTRDQGAGDVMDMMASIGFPPDQQAPCNQVSYRDCLCGEAARSQQVLNVDAKHCPEDLLYPDPTPRGRIALPLLAGECTLGVLMHTVMGSEGVSPEEERFLRQVADVLSMSISRRYADDRIAYMVYHDELTGLLNRASLNDSLATELQRADRHATAFAVLFVDMDHFKQVNDVLGHGVGDSYLRESARRLTTAIRSGDVLCRWGSDEFVVLALDLGEDVEQASASVQAVAFKIAEMLARPVSIEGQEVQLNASIGIALHPGDGQNAAELLQRAELAMFRAKQAGRNQVHFFRPEMQGEATRRLTLGRELHRAIEEQQFLLHYQPQVDANGKLHGAEALVRWQHPTRGLVFPGEFIDLSEELGLIVPLGEWVLAEGIRWLCARTAGGACEHPALLSVNVSGRQFHESNFVDRCLALVEQAGISAQCLELEVTESLLLADIEGARSKIARLRDAGFHFSVDDFGTGYSSLAYLKSLPVQKLKIDRSFVQDVHLDERNAAIVRTIIALAENLGMITIAEGVEQKEEVDFLKEAGCELFQGYYFSKPVSANEFAMTWLKQPSAG